MLLFDLPLAAMVGSCLNSPALTSFHQNVKMVEIHGNAIVIIITNNWFSQSISHF